MRASNVEHIALSVVVVFVIPLLLSHIGNAKYATLRHNNLLDRHSHCELALSERPNSCHVFDIKADSFLIGLSSTNSPICHALSEMQFCRHVFKSGYLSEGRPSTTAIHYQCYNPKRYTSAFYYKLNSTDALKSERKHRCMDTHI